MAKIMYTSLSRETQDYDDNKNNKSDNNNNNEDASVAGILTCDNWPSVHPMSISLTGQWMHQRSAVEVKDSHYALFADVKSRQL